MRNIVGQVAKGDDFFLRHKEIGQITSALENGANILLTAPRRVGKTSILYHFSENQSKDNPFLYMITESVDSRREFYERLINLLIESKSTLSKSAVSFKNLLSKVKGLKIAGSGVELDTKVERDLPKDALAVLRSVAENQIKLVIMVDEFPQALINISKKQNESESIKLLQELREMRHDPAILGRIQFIFTGSIGLQNVVSKLESSALISDLMEITVDPLSRPEAEDFLSRLSQSMRLGLDQNQIAMMLDLIEWYIPFHLQVFMQELQTKIKRDGRTADEQLMTDVVDIIVNKKAYFDHWKNRLRTNLSEDDFVIATEILNVVAKSGAIAREEISALTGMPRSASNKKNHKASKRLASLVDMLLHDGYLQVCSNNPPKYSFLSPFLKLWWRQNVAI